MANDAVRTRFVVVNVNPERGMVLGGNVADIVHKTAELGGGVLLLPHFVVHGEAEARFHSFAELEGLKTKGRVKLFSEPFCREGDDEESTFSELEQTWWKGGGAADSAASKVVEAMLKGDGGSLFRSKLQVRRSEERSNERRQLATLSNLLLIYMIKLAPPTSRFAPRLTPFAIRFAHRSRFCSLIVRGRGRGF